MAIERNAAVIPVFPDAKNRWVSRPGGSGGNVQIALGSADQSVSGPIPQRAERVNHSDLPVPDPKPGLFTSRDWFARTVVAEFARIPTQLVFLSRNSREFRYGV